METWLLIVIIASVLVVGVILYLVLAGGDEEEAEEKMAPPQKVIDLDDERALARLTEKHLQVNIDAPTYLTVKDEGKTGFEWILHEESGCEKVMTIEKIDKLPPPPGAEEKPEGDKKAEGKGEKKRLRDEVPQPPPGFDEEGEGAASHNWSLTGDKEGECTFAMAYVNAADADKFDWEAIEDSEDRVI